MRQRLAVTALAAMTPAALLLAAAPAQAADPATVFVLHGVPEATVDVYVNDKLTLDDFKPGTLTDALSLPAGTYSVKVTDPTDATKVIIGPADVPVAAGKSYTIVAHLGVDGKPTATPFENDISPAGAGNGRVTVRHVANAPEVTVKADGAALGNVANPKEIKADVPAKTYAVTVEPASGGAAVFSTDLAVKEGVNTIVYAWGDLAGGSFAAAVQTIGGLHSAPGGVPAGELGLASDGNSPAGMPAWALGLMAAAAVGAAFSARRLAVLPSRG